MILLAIDAHRVADAAVAAVAQLATAGHAEVLVLGSVTRDLVRRTTRPVLLAEAAERRKREVGGIPAAAWSEPGSRPAADRGPNEGQVR